MEYFNNDYAYAGFFASSGVGFLHFQDLFVALVLGFFGALGGYIFKLIKEKWLNRKQ